MKKALALTAFLVGTALAGPGNNSLIIGTSQEPPNIYDPWNTNNLVITSEVNNFMGAALTYLDNGGKVLADMATQVPTLANGGYKEVKDGSGKATTYAKENPGKVAAGVAALALGAGLIYAAVNRDKD